MKFVPIIIISLFLFSCRSVKVNKTQTKSIIDSTSIERTDSSGFKKEEVVTVKTEEEGEGNDLSVEFDIDDTTSKVRPDDFLQPGPWPPDPVITIDSAGNIKITGKVKKFTMKTNTFKKTVDSTARVTFDTASKFRTKTVELKKEEKSEVVQKDKKGIPFGNLFLITIFIAAAIFLFWYLRRKKPS